MNRRTWRGLVMSVVMLVWVGLLAIGTSGLISAGLSAAFGPEFIAGDFPGTTYTAERCADFQRLAPAATCAQAAALHHADEVVGYRIDAGVLGLLVLAGWWIARHGPRDEADALPAGIVSSAGAAMFGVVGLALAGLGMSLLGLGSATGAGAYLSAGLVSLFVSAVFAARLYRELRAWSPGLTRPTGK